MSETATITPETPVSIDDIRRTIGNVVASGEITEYARLIHDLGHVPVWIEDPTGEFPLSRHPIGGLMAELGSMGINRLFWRVEPGDAEGAGTEHAEFTITPDNLGAITRVLSEEDIE